MSVGVARAMFELLSDECDCETRPCCEDDTCCVPLLVKGARWPEPNNTDDIEDESAWWNVGLLRQVPVHDESHTAQT